MDCTNSLLSYWALNKPGGGKPIPAANLVFYNALDSWSTKSSSGHNITYRGSADSPVLPTATTYKGIKCCEFGADSWWSATTNVKASQKAYKGTLSFWLAPKQTLSTSYPMGVIVGCMNTTSNGRYNYGVFKSSSPAKWRLGFQNNTVYVTYDDTPNTVKWHHFAVTLTVGEGWTNTTRSMTVWVDGVKVDEGTASVPNYALSHTVFGNSNTSHNAVYIAGIRLYNKILSAEDIQLLAAEYSPTD